DLFKRKRATHAVIRERLLEKSFCHDLSSQNNDTSAWCGSAHKNGNSWDTNGAFQSRLPACKK
ncbi:MAG: hypothetical protein MR444_11585, partial [Lachnospiraceae bacterium]|nr:hypothetical protein [Lachnospiraceae bacterium]